MLPPRGWRAVFRRAFSVDFRALAIWRAALALTTLADLCERWTDARALYSDEGFVPRSLMTDCLGAAQFPSMCVRVLTSEISLTIDFWR